MSANLRPDYACASCRVLPGNPPTVVVSQGFGAVTWIALGDYLCSFPPGYELPPDSVFHATSNDPIPCLITAEPIGAPITAIRVHTHQSVGVPIDAPFSLSVMRV